jgi:hypothetical protein
MSSSAGAYGGDHGDTNLVDVGLGTERSYHANADPFGTSVIIVIIIILIVIAIRGASICGVTRAARGAPIISPCFVLIILIILIILIVLITIITIIIATTIIVIISITASH